MDRDKGKLKTRGTEMKKSRSPEDVLQSCPPEVQALAEKARRLLLKLLSGAEETADPTQSILSYGYGPGYRGMVCTLLLSKSGVKIGIVNGAELSDPSGLLEGTGKKHKYIQLKTAADLNRSGVKELIAAAHAAWRQRNA
jgi:hypothetical protein